MASITQLGHQRLAQTPAFEPFHVLRLPSELRNLVYDAVIANHDDQSRIMACHDHPIAESYRPSPRQPTLAVTNRQIRHEMLSIFYGRRTFFILWREIESKMGLSTWTSIMKPSLFYLRSVEFELPTEEPKTSVLVHLTLKEAIGLQCACEVRTTIVGYQDMCMCKFARCARDVRRGAVGSKDDASVIRFLLAWNISPPSPSAKQDEHCSVCGRKDVFVSLKNGKPVSSQRDLSTLGDVV